MTRQDLTKLAELRRAAEASTVMGSRAWSEFHDTVKRIPPETWEALARVVVAARGAVEACGFWNDGRYDRVRWPVDQDGNSEPDDDAPMVALREALAALEAAPE